MPINLVVAVTDYDWFRTLRERQPQPSEVNFWSPSARNFRALRPGELFLFKLRGSRNMIAGGGVYTHSTILPLSRAWELFGQANGAHSFEDMRRRIAGLRDSGPDGKTDFDIGCRILTQSFFLDESDWIETPPDFAKNIVTFKTYDTENPMGRHLWEQVQDRLRRQAARRAVALIADEIARYGSPQLVEPRLGQGGFRAVVTDIYDRQCAVTGERTLPALDAAHIIPYSHGGPHAATNGILLRKDIHSLFDAGYVTVTPGYRFRVSDSIEVEFGNGHEYYALSGREIIVPRLRESRPDRGALEWHNTHVFKD